VVLNIIVYLFHILNIRKNTFCEIFLESVDHKTLGIEEMRKYKFALCVCCKLFRIILKQFNIETLKNNDSTMPFIRTQTTFCLKIFDMCFVCLALLKMLMLLSMSVSVFAYVHCLSVPVAFEAIINSN
jgi:hypothetical protein